MATTVLRSDPRALGQFSRCSPTGRWLRLPKSCVALPPRTKRHTYEQPTPADGTPENGEYCGSEEELTQQVSGLSWGAAGTDWFAWATVGATGTLRKRRLSAGTLAGVPAGETSRTSNWYAHWSSRPERQSQVLSSAELASRPSSARCSMMNLARTRQRAASAACRSVLIRMASRRIAGGLYGTDRACHSQPGDLRASSAKGCRTDLSRATRATERIRPRRSRAGNQSYSVPGWPDSQ